MTAVRDNDQDDDVNEFNDEWKKFKYPLFTCVLKSIALITANI